ncbi:hypothetical protein F511_29869 [Dorcoceras hygrometricum]|uniref:Peptidase A1 domain-containing protein n=1 Tax=Dorcoceras hygrometricum TaxID=472368 RepID=A0A2Z7D3R7_9LAMI|nr:hypothetical protein F511_29869 [Dorcoceras hygrometricum]
MALFISSNIFFFIVASFLFLPPFSIAEVTDQNDGFSVDLIRIESIISRKRNSSATRWDHVNNAILRSKNRADKGSGFPSLNAQLKRRMIADGDFVMRLSIGTPPTEIMGLVDTGGNLLWTLCQSCAPPCPKQNRAVFAPERSSTYKNLIRNNRLCVYLNGGKISSRFGRDPCRYELSYYGNFLSFGVISSDTVTLNTSSGPPVSRQNIAFGCATNNQGHFNWKSLSGVIGLGAGPGSLITQMKDVIGGKFSYCLVPHTKTKYGPSKMYFGNQALVSRLPWTISTGLHIYKNTYYAARFKGLSVDGMKLATGSRFPSLFNDRIIIESGTILTYLPRKYYNPLELAISKRMELRYEVAYNPDRELKVCYRSKDDYIEAPVVTLHFVGVDTDLKLSPRNTFIKVADDVHCLGIVPHDDITATLGNLAQDNFLVGFDLNRQTVSFKSTDCSRIRLV